VRDHIRAFGLLSALLAAACGGRPALPQPPELETLRVRTSDRGVETVRDVPIEDYVAAAALSEFAPAAGDPTAVEAMFEVQAIIVRTYARAHRGRHAQEGFDLCSTSHCQIYEPGRLGTSRWASAAREAVSRTAGLILTYDGAPADAVYHADCGGWTSAAAEVWGGAGLPYLRAARDDGEAKDAHAAWQYAVDADTLRRALDGDPRTRVGGTLSSIAILTRDVSGRAERVRLHGAADVEVRGADLRDVVAAALGARSVRSTLFDVVRSGSQFVFSGRGFGHGVGLCQVGAFARVTAGDAPRTVLQHYYPGTVVVGSPRIRPSSRTPRG
jgi:stage II sporulation protein D (peptidoglycan lytic transglycosylase)